MTGFLVLDVFADRPFGGNQLAVIPDASGLPEAALQEVAREFGFSETTFVYAPSDPAHTARVRIFTPAAEIPFAGHPIVGTAVALAHLGRGGPEMVLELGRGPVPVRVTEGGARFSVPAELQRLAEPEAALAAASASLSPEDLDTSGGTPLLASLGNPFLLIELRDLDALARAEPARGPISELRQRHGGGSDFLALYLFVRRGSEVRARMFAPLSGIVEDPATGSAAATLGALLAEREGGGVAFVLTQGLEMGRPSRIDVDVREGRVAVSGRAVLVMEGRLLVPGLPTTPPMA